MKTYNPTMNENYTPIGITIGIVANLMKRFPQGITDFCYRIICALFGGFIFAPFVIKSSVFISQEFSYLSFINPEVNSSVVPFIYCITIMFAEPIVTLFMKIFEEYLPRRIKSTLIKNDND